MLDTTMSYACRACLSPCSIAVRTARCNRPTENNIAESVSEKSHISAESRWEMSDCVPQHRLKSSLDCQ